MPEATNVDGRRARGLKTRAAIVTALMDLVAAGEITPTAQRIADRAEVSVRSVYQHFTDVESLFSQAAAQLYEWVSQRIVPIDTSLPLEERVAAFVAARSDMLEALTPFSRASIALEANSQSLRDARLHLLREGRERLNQIFEPELSRLNDGARQDLLGALDMLTGWAAWDQLRFSGATFITARRVLAGGTLALLRSAGSAAAPKPSSS